MEAPAHGRLPDGCLVDLVALFSRSAQYESDLQGEGERAHSQAMEDTQSFHTPGIKTDRARRNLHLDADVPCTKTVSTKHAAAARIADPTKGRILKAVNEGEATLCCRQLLHLHGGTPVRPGTW